MAEKSYLVHWRERQRRMRESLEAAWRTADGEEGDPGLRRAYPSIHRAPIRLITCRLDKDVNQGGLLRLAEAFRLEEVTFSREADGAVDFSASRGSRRYQPWRWLDAEEAIRTAENDGYTPVALTLDPSARPLPSVSWTFPLALVIGNELEGVPADVRDRCHDAVAIPLYGLVTSLNVVTAAGIAVYAAVEAYRSQTSFEPVRRRSRGLLGLEPVDYESARA